MIKKVFVGLMVALFGICAFAQNVSTKGLPKLKAGMPYTQARLVLMSKGLTPVKLPRMNDQGECTGPICGDMCFEEDERCEGIPEMYRCSGSGLAQCQYMWVTQDDKVIGVCTQGETPMFNGYCPIE